MSLAINLTPHWNQTLPSRHHFQGIHDFSHMVNRSVLLPSYLAKMNNTHLHQSLHIRSCLSGSSSNWMIGISADVFITKKGQQGIHDVMKQQVLMLMLMTGTVTGQADGLSDEYKNEGICYLGFLKHAVGSVEREDNKKGELLTNNEVLKKLRRYGVSGILSYGLLNTAYYVTTFLFVWLYVVPSPGKMGYLAAVERFLKVMAMVWAGSQVTKLVRAGGALAMAPFVDRGLSWFTIKFKFQSQGKAFMTIVAFCFGVAICLFLVITLLWA
ncbi:uncharacterized protein G2W53_022935 [Senna tora]|uniref:Uncharacterized protein n=1 Tax=Senna tora TaxID=362788 RepID=A0A834TPY2_9FABA|nr:uncharacterized protein G2W53_022935 [Senna tora]